MRHIYGPVPSRRLGQSLGVDPVPFKSCNYNCVYCQLGRTIPLTNKRKVFFPPQNILAELQLALDANKKSQIDYITFVGQGEPLLYAGMGQLIRGAKALTDIPIAVITNGSLLYIPEVGEAICAADVVIPTLDAGDEETFHRINRPWPTLHNAQIVEGMTAFRQIFNGQLWVEVMLVKGLNDKAEALTSIATALQNIQPDQVHLNIPIRPPAEAWVEIPDNESLIRATTILGTVAAIVTSAEGYFGLTDDMSVVDAIVKIIRRHPMRETELLENLRRFIKQPDQVQTTLEALEASGQARRHIYQDQVFWEYAGGRFASSTKQKGI